MKKYIKPYMEVIDLKARGLMEDMGVHGSTAVDQDPNNNTSGSGSFLVAALMEGRNFLGIEKNADSELFKNEKIDYIEKTKERLHAVWQHLDADTRNHLKALNLINEFK
jgi:hypothetical protein